MAKTELPAWSKGVIGIVIAGAGGFALFKIYQYFGKLKEREGQQAEIDTTTKALTDLTKAGKGGSLTEVQYTRGELFFVNYYYPFFLVFNETAD